MYHEYEDGTRVHSNGQHLGYGFSEPNTVIPMEFTDQELTAKMEGAFRFFAYRGWTVEQLTGMTEETLKEIYDFRSLANWARYTWSELHTIGLNCTLEKAIEVSKRRMNEFLEEKNYAGN